MTGGGGTARGWICVTAPPARRNEFDGISEEDANELSRIFGLPPNYFRGSAYPISSAEQPHFVRLAEEPNLSDLPKTTAANDAA